MITFAKTAFTRTMSAIVVAASLFSVGTASASGWVDVGNAGSSEIVGVYISDSDSGTWGRDLLGPDYIDVGYELGVYRPDGCYFDVLVEFADGSETIAWNENLCGIHDIVFDEYGYLV